MLRDKIRAERTLSVNEVYESIQGEGLLAGMPSLFIRLQGCNLRCPWCDQPEALDFKEGTLSTEELLEKVRRSPFRHAVVTGGEPFAHGGLPYLIELLLEEGFSVQIETNGTLWIPEVEKFAPDLHITCSPKGVAGFFVHPKILEYARELKFVVDGELTPDTLLRKEFEPFLRKGKVVLQPEGNKERFFRKALSIQRELASKGFGVRVLPQIHKLLGLP